MIGQSVRRPLAGLLTILVIAAIVATAVGLFRGDFAKTIPVTVISERAGLVLNPDAKVKMQGVQMGSVAAIENLPDGQAAIHLAMEPSALQFIPSNVRVSIESTTVFGAKFVSLVEPARPSPEPLREGQVLSADHVTVEINTVFQQLVSVLAKIRPEKLNETLGALAQSLNDRGQRFGQALADLDSFLATVEPSLSALSHDIAVAPTVLNTYADAAPDLLTAVHHATGVSRTIVDQQRNLDALLVSLIGLADTGNDVVGRNRQALTDVLRLVAPTTDLTNAYSAGLTCGLKGLLPIALQPPLAEPGVVILAGIGLGRERYRYPVNLPKVAATGGPRCEGLPDLPKGTATPFVLTDVGSNPWQYGNPGILLNADGLKQLLYGPIDGPPRNTAQIGMPG